MYILLTTTEAANVRHHVRYHVRYHVRHNVRCHGDTRLVRPINCDEFFTNTLSLVRIKYLFPLTILYEISITN